MVFQTLLALALATHPLFGRVLPAEHVPPVVIAHRGGLVGEDSPECSATAIRRAAAAGYAMVELDVQPTADDAPFVFHDRDLKKTCGVEGSLQQRSAEEADALRFLATGEKVLRLKEALSLCVELKLGVMLDIKRGTSPEFFRQVRQALEEAQLTGRVLCINRAPEVLEHLQGAVVFRVDDSGPEGEYWFGLPQDLPNEKIDALKQKGVALVPGINRFRYEDKSHFHDAWRDILRLNDAGVDAFQIDSMYDHLVPGFTQGAGDNLMVNGNFSDWSNPVPAGVTTTSVGTPPGSLPLHWYGGPGVGATATYSRQAFEPASPELPGAPPYFFRVAWSVPPAAEWPGETHHQPAFRGTFLEYFGLTDVYALAGKTVLLSFYARSSQPELKIVPILWHSYGQTAPADGPKKGRDYELFESSGAPGVVAVAQGAPGNPAPVTLKTEWQYHEKIISLPVIGTTYVANGHYTGVGFDIIERAAPKIDLALVQLRVLSSKH